MKIVIDEDIPFIKGAFEPYANVLYVQGARVSRNDVMDADALIVRTRTPCNAALLQGSTVRYIASATIGYDHIDTVWCAQNGIEWSNAAGCNSSSVGQYILAALLEIARRKTIDLSQKTIGIVGVGHVGSIVRRIAEALHMRVLLNDPPRERLEGGKNFVSLDTLARQADIITLHTPLVRAGKFKTHHLLNSVLINKTKTGVVVLNTSRGEVIDQHALKTAIANKHIGATVLDVWANEPAIDQQLLSMVDIATPHIAGYSTNGKAKATEMVVQCIARFFKLPLEGWSVKDTLIIENCNIIVDCSYTTVQQLLQQIVPLSYNIMRDDFNLRAAIDKFEYLRKNYPIRREFTNYSVAFGAKIEISEDIALQLNGIGFNVLKNK